MWTTVFRRIEALEYEMFETIPQELGAIAARDAYLDPEPEAPFPEMSRGELEAEEFLSDQAALTKVPQDAHPSRMESLQAVKEARLAQNPVQGVKNLTQRMRTERQKQSDNMPAGGSENYALYMEQRRREGSRPGDATNPGGRKFWRRSGRGRPAA